MAASREVGLTDEISVLLGRALNLFKLLDRKFQLIPKLQAIFAFIMGKITEIIGRYNDVCPYLFSILPLLFLLFVLSQTSSTR